MGTKQVRLYKALVAPTINYASAVWFPRTATGRMQIENIQRAFTRRLLDRRQFYYCQRLEKLGLRSVLETSIIHDVHLFYKVQKYEDSRFALYFQKFDFLSNIGSRRRSSRNKHRFHVDKPFRFTSTELENAWYIRTIDVWNSLSEDTVKSNSFNRFKNLFIANDLPTVKHKFCSDFLSHFE